MVVEPMTFKDLPILSFWEVLANSELIDSVLGS